MKKKSVIESIQRTQKHLKIIALHLNKGGSGKSTHSFNLGRFIAETLNMRVLYIDGDRSRNLTKTLRATGNLTIADIFKSQKTEFVKTNNKNIDIIVGAREFTDEGVSASDFNTKYLELFDWIGRNEDYLVEHYDFIIIDTHNDTSKVTFNLLAASDLIVAPATPDGDSYDGVLELIEDYNNVIVPATRMPRSNISFADADIAILPNRIKMTGVNLVNTSEEFIDDLKANPTIAENVTILGNIIERDIFSISRLENKSVFELYEELPAKSKKNTTEYIKHVEGIYLDIVKLACEKVLSREGV